MDNDVIEEIKRNGFDFEEELENHNLELENDEITGYDEDIEEFLSKMVEEVGVDLVRKLISGQKEVEALLDEVISYEKEQDFNYKQVLNEAENELKKVNEQEVDKVANTISKTELNIELDDIRTNGKLEGNAKSLIEELKENGYDVENTFVTDLKKLLKYLTKVIGFIDDETFKENKDYYREKLGKKNAKPIIDAMYIIIFSKIRYT